jgi:hypothetical protein
VGQEDLQSRTSPLPSPQTLSHERSSPETHRGSQAEMVGTAEEAITVEVSDMVSCEMLGAEHVEYKKLTQAA